MIKALFFDLDGTLLDNNKQIPHSAIDALNQCKKNDIKIFISTARAPLLDKMLGWEENILTLFDGGSYCNGAIIKTPNIIRYNYIESHFVKKLTEIIAKYPDVHYALNLTDEYHVFNHYLPDEMLEPWGLTRDKISAFSDEALSETVKVIIYHNYLVDSETELPVELYDELVKIFSEDLKIYLQDKGKTIQISAEGINKCSAIKYICNIYGYDSMDKRDYIYYLELNDDKMYLPKADVVDMLK
jgi:HAD superfamily hydrolase (TIGR01484 family)